jgi:hypothetical protein
MAKQIINIGTAPNTGSGEPLRTAFQKVNENFADTEFSHIELTNTEVSFVGTLFTFTKTNYGSEVDYIDEGLAITRGDDQGIYNITVEPEYDRDTRISPANTEWNADGWNNLSNVTSRTYTTWRDALDTNVAAIVGQELIMHDLTNDKYWGVKFTQWTQGVDPMGAQGGGFAYTRQLIDVNAGKGITFPDNSVQRKAVNDVSDLTDTNKLLGNGKTWYSSATNSLWKVVERSGGTNIQTAEPEVEDIVTEVVNTFDGTSFYVPRNESTQRIQDYWDGVEGGYDYTRIVFNDVEYEGFVTTYDGTGWRIQLDSGPLSANSGDPVTIRYYGNPAPVKWFDADNFDNSENFLGAKINYYAFVQGRGQRIGTVWFTANHDEYGDFDAEEVGDRSGNYTDLQMSIRPDSQLPFTSLWLSTNSPTSETVSVMWDAKMFYGENAIITPDIIDD